jgi:gamma-glutamylputrescine oxidase
MLATTPLDEELFTWPCYADEGFQYWRQLADGRLVIGGWRNRSFDSEYTDDETPCSPVQDHIERFLRETLRVPPERAAIERRWAGIMAFSPDGEPMVGHVPASLRCYVAGAYTGHGNAYALTAAQVVAELIRQGTHPEADLFDPARFAPDGR